MKRFSVNPWLLFAAITLAGFLIDWFTKFSAVNKLLPGVPFRVAGDYVQMYLVYNRAALWGLDPRVLLPWFPLNIFFTVFSFVAMGVIVFYFNRIKDSEPFTRWGLMLIMPGALGNLFDRIVYPQRGVVDFIKIGISPTQYWPVFNCADIFVSAGVGLVLLGLFLDEHRKRALALHPKP